MRQRDRDCASAYQAFGSSSSARVETRCARRRAGPGDTAPCPSVFCATGRPRREVDGRGAHAESPRRAGPSRATAAPARRDGGVRAIDGAGSRSGSRSAVSRTPLVHVGGGHLEVVRGRRRRRQRLTGPRCSAGIVRLRAPESTAPATSASRASRACHLSGLRRGRVDDTGRGPPRSTDGVPW